MTDHHAFALRTLAAASYGLCLAVMAMLAGCAAAPDSATEAASKPAKASYGEYAGPKKRLAVSKFGAHGKFAERYGGWDIGGGLAAQLASELERTGRFRVIERAALSEILRQQELTAEGLTAGETGPRAGKLLGAQMLVRGEVTEFGPQSEGGGFSLGIGDGLLSSALGLEGSTAHIGMDLRLIDTTTGEVLHTFHTEAQAESRDVAIDLAMEDISFGGDRFYETPLGEATRRGTRRAVQRIIDAMEPVPWQARVARFEAGKVYVNAGRDARLSKGDRLVCYRVTDRVTDPVTEEVLGVERQRIGTIRLQRVRGRYAVGSFQGSVSPRRGDLVRLEGAQAGSG